MAASSVITGRQLQLKYNFGENQDGTPKTVSQRLKVNASASDEVLYGLAGLVGAVLASPLTKIEKIDTSSVISE